MSLTRADIEEGRLQKILHSPELGLCVLSNAQLQTSIRVKMTVFLEQITTDAAAWSAKALRHR
jgi:hypothetical protein